VCVPIIPVFVLCLCVFDLGVFVVFCFVKTDIPTCHHHFSLQHSALADRIKIAKKGQGDEVNLSIQFILNCGADVAGSCHGGYHSGVYQLIKNTGFIPYETCQTYMACSAESTEGFCEHVDTTCSAANICKTCNTFSSRGGECTEVSGRHGCFSLCVACVCFMISQPFY